MKDRSKQGIKGDQKEQRQCKNQNKTSKSKVAFSREKGEDIASTKRKLVASQKEHSEKRNMLLY